MEHGPEQILESVLYQGLVAVAFVIVLALYIAAGLWSNRKSHLRDWPVYRYVLFSLGIVISASAVTGPLASRAMMDFQAHMAGHLFLGMLGPLLLALSAPMTLLLRTLPQPFAIKVTGVLKSPPVRTISHPVTASILNVGGLWVLYTTEIYSAMHHHLWLHLLVHFHVFAAGYLFTVAFVYIDPVPHRYSYVYRTVVFIIALAGHGVLSKYIYFQPPPGVMKGEAEMGGMLMYYGGDVIDAVIIFLLCYQWYKAARPRSSIAPAPVK